TRLNSVTLARHVTNDPSLVGRTIRFSMPIANEIDRYLKGQATGREWLDLRAPPVVSPDAGEDAPVRIALSAADAARIAEETETATPDRDTRSAILFADGGAWRLARIGAAAEGEMLAAPAGTGGAARVLVLRAPETNRRVS